MNEDKTLLKLQNHLYGMLIAFDKMCKEHDLVYYLAYGTLLGAVRHQGFIPWDDDVDVVMPREDYDKLLTIYEDVLPSNFVLHYYKNTPNHFLSFAKICDKNTTVVEKANYANDYRIEGIYIDIFPLDGMGDNYKKAYNRAQRTLIYKTIIDSSTEVFERKKRALWKQIIINWGRLFDSKKVQEKLDRFLRKKPYAKSKYISMASGSHSTRRVVKKEIFGTPQKIKFGDYYFNAPEQAEEYLRIEYGDFMKLPPEEKRVGHSSIVYADLELPFDKFDIKLLEQVDNKTKG